jgi:poly(3-hydroxybutyrate) depolymerase
MRSVTFAALMLLIGAAFVRTDAQSEQDLHFKVTANGREYRVFVPDGFGKTGPGPAVVLFNGSGSAVDGLLDPWKAIARKEGVMLIGQTAAAQGAWRIPQDSPDPTQLVVEDAKSRFPIDQRRVYLFGHSGGAGHVILLGLLESEYFAAVALHAGALRSSDRKLLDVPPRKIPIAIWSGTQDQMVPIKMVRDTLAVLTSRGFPAKAVEIPGHTHSYAERSDEVTAAAWAFLKNESLPADPRYARYQFP